METIPVLIPYGYRVDDADVREAKSYILRRESTAAALSSLIDALLKDTAEEITRICYLHGIDPARFTITSRYDEKMFDDVCNVLDNLEDEIMDLLLDYATRCTKDEERKRKLLPWILLLGRGRRDLKQTLEDRIKMFVKDVEAMIASMALANVGMQKAIDKIRSNIHSVYVTPEVKRAFDKSVKTRATNIRNRGVKHGNVGNSNSEANNILRFAEITLQMAWMHNRLMDFQEQGVDGYIVMRGSNYPCDLCDSRTGWHPIEDTDAFPPQHPHCVCYTIPLFRQ